MKRRSPTSSSPPTSRKFSPVQGRVVPRFSGIKTFFRLPHHTEASDVDVMVVGIPFDGTATYRGGSRFAPSAIREAGSLSRTYNWEARADVFEKLDVCDGGDFFVNVLNTEESHRQIEEQAAAVLKKGARLLSVGGDHSITLPLLRAMKKQYKTPVAFIQVDAHADTYGPAWGVDIHHGTFARHAVEEKLIHPKHILQVGLRGPVATPDDFEFGLSKGFQVLEASSLHTKEWNWTQTKVATWKREVKDLPVYISFDIDGVDPAFAPGTGTPVPGGLTSWQALEFLRLLKGLTIASADVVEVSPAYDVGGTTSLLASAVLFELLSLMSSP